MAPAVAERIREIEEERVLEANDTVPTDDLDEVATAAGSGDAAADRLRSRLAEAGLLLAAGRPRVSIDAWWERVAGDATFAAGDRLYEGRAWAFQSLSRERFGAHAAAGDVVVAETGSGWAAGILCLRPLFAEDDEPYVGLLVGEAGAAAKLLGRLRDVFPRLPRLRLPASLPLFAGDPEPLLNLGLRAGDHAGHLFERHLDPAAPPPTVSPAAMLRLVDTPQRIATPPRVGP